MSLSADLKKFAKMAREKQEQVVRASFIHLGTEMEIKSPVDKGIFRANWRANLGSIDSDNSSGAGRDSVGAISVALGGFKVGQVYYYTNSMPYAIALEFGHSEQAANGMVRLAARRWNMIVEAEIRAVK